MADGSAKAGGVVIITMTASLGIVYVVRIASSPADVLRKPGQMLRIAVGGSLVTLALLMTAEVSPKFARTFSTMILLGVLIGYGSPFAQIVSRSIGKPPAFGPMRGENIRLGGDRAQELQAMIRSNTPPLSLGGDRAQALSAWNLTTR